MEATPVEKLRSLRSVTKALLRKRVHSAKMRADSRVGTGERQFRRRLQGMRRQIVISATVAAIVCAFALLPHAARARGETVAVKDSYMAGTIVVRTGERHLYYFTGYGQAIRYPVGVGRAGKQWSGTSFINGKYIRPDWSPPDEVRHDHPGLPKVIKGGSPRNPMGLAAMSLAGGEYAI